MSPRRRSRHAGAPEDTLLHEGMAALATALLHDEDAADEVVRAATGYGRRGEPLDLLLADLDRCFVMINGRLTDPETTRLAAVTWACEMSAHYAHVTCVDPLTGLATPEHLRARALEIYRAAAREGRPPGDDHALVVVTIRPRPGRASSLARSELAAGVRMALVSDHLRRHYAGDEVIGVLRDDRIGILTGASTPRDAQDRLGTHAAGHLGLGRVRFDSQVLRLPDDVAGALDLLAGIAPALVSPTR